MERRYLYLSWFLILLFSSFRLLYILSCSIDLSPDEAQYWNWSRHLGISYYTKGPLIAYLLRMTTAVFGDNVLGVRSLALITSTISYLAVLYFTKKVFDTKTAFLTVLIGEFLPISNAGAIISHVDAPLLLLWTFSFIYAYKMENKNTVSWIFLGVLIGLGFLAKYSMYLFVFSLIIYLLFTKKGRIIISNRFIFMLLAIIIVSMPVFIWSFEHSFANFFHLFHLTKIGEGRWLSFSSLGDYIGGQAGALSPVFFIVYIISMFFCLKKKLYYLFFFSFPIFLLFLIVSIHTSVYANWPGCAYVAGTIATAFYLKNKKKLLILCMVVAFLFDFFAYGNNLLYIFLKNPKQNPANRLKGWSELACEVDDIRKKYPQSFVISDNYKISSEMAFYLKDQPQTFVFSPDKITQYTFWKGYPKKGTAIFITYGDDKVPGNFGRMCKREKTVNIIRMNRVIRTFAIWSCKVDKN